MKREIERIDLISKGYTATTMEAELDVSAGGE